MADSRSFSCGSPSGPPTKKLREQRPLDPAKMTVAYDPDSDEEDYCPKGVTKMEHLVWDRYVQQIQESQGFYIVDFPGVCFMASIVPLNIHNSPTQTQTLIELSTLAIQEYNKQNQRTKYEFVKVEKANASACAGIIYYITFQAKKRKHRDPAVKKFRAKVWQKIPMTDKEVEFCRLKQKPENSQDNV